MKVDKIKSRCLVVIPKLPLTSEIQVLSKEDRIKHLVKEHLLLWRKCQVATQEGPTARLPLRRVRRLFRNS
jgi:hypothetical protein